MSDDQLTIKLNHLADSIKQVVKNDLPIVAGKMAVDFFKQSFHNEGFTDEALVKWPDVKRRHDQRVRGARATRKILTGDTGDLGESITYEIRSPSEVVIKAEAFSKSGFNYAPVHNYGVTDAGRNRSTVIPRRQFMGPSKTLDRLIMDEIERKLNETIK